MKPAVYSARWGPRDVKRMGFNMCFRGFLWCLFSLGRGPRCFPMEKNNTNINNIVKQRNRLERTTLRQITDVLTSVSDTVYTWIGNWDITSMDRWSTKSPKLDQSYCEYICLVECIYSPGSVIVYTHTVLSRIMTLFWPDKCRMTGRWLSTYW